MLMDIGVYRDFSGFNRGWFLVEGKIDLLINLLTNFEHLNLK